MNIGDRAAEALLDELRPAKVPSQQRVLGPQAVDMAFAALTRKRWRRSALDEASAADTAAKLQDAFDNRRPIELSIPFGGYKGWRVQSSPLPNWAEVFSLAHFRRSLAPVAAVWPYGVHVDFTYIGGVMDLVSNLALARQDAYMRALQSALEMYSSAELRFSAIDLSSSFADGSARRALLQRFEVVSVEWQTRPQSEEQRKKKASAARNLMWIDSREPTEEAVTRSAIMCDALDSLPERRAFNKYGRHIQLVFVRGPKPAIHVGSCVTSSNHFWVSSGVLENHGKRLLPRLIPHDNALQVAESLETADLVRDTGVRDWPALRSVSVVAHG